MVNKHFSFFFFVHEQFTLVISIVSTDSVNEEEKTFQDKSNKPISKTIVLKWYKNAEWLKDN